MMNKQRTKTQTETTTQTETLSSIEEKVVRMRHGLGAPKDMPLEMQGQGHPETMAKLMEMEQRALEAVGPRSNAAKRRIVGALRRVRE